MAEIFNLRQARKARARAEKEQNAEFNRAKFGQSKAERLKRELQAERDSQKHDAHKLQSRDAEPSDHD